MQGVGEHNGNGAGFDAGFGAGFGFDSDRPILDIELDPPIVGSNGQTYTSLHFEEPTGNMVERAESELAMNMSVHSLRRYQMSLVSLGANVPRDVVGKMRISQIQEAGDFLSRFIGAGPRIGAN